jgi:hypothetical protein
LVGRGQKRCFTVLARRAGDGSTPALSSIRWREMVQAPRHIIYEQTLMSTERTRS